MATAEWSEAEHDDAELSKQSPLRGWQASLRSSLHCLGTFLCSFAFLLNSRFNIAAQYLLPGGGTGPTACVTLCDVPDT